MDGNFNNDQQFNQDGYGQNGYSQDGYSQNGYSQDLNYQNNYEPVNQKQFGDASPMHNHADMEGAKTSLSIGILVILGSLGSIFAYFFLHRIFYIMVVFPFVAVGGIIAAIKALKNDRGLPKAYFGLILNIIGFFPALLCFLLFFLDLIACFMK